MDQLDDELLDAAHELRQSGMYSLARAVDDARQKIAPGSGARLTNSAQLEMAAMREALG